MTDRNFLISQSMLLFASFLDYQSSGNPGHLVFILGIIGVLISTSELINFNQTIYHLTFLAIIVVQTILLVNAYLFKMTYLTNNHQYAVCAVGVMAYIVIIALLFKPDIFKGNFQLKIYKKKSS